MKPRIILFLLIACIAVSVQAQLRVTYPNGGESFKAGSKITITWSGVNASDVVTLEFSTDGGTSWNLITNAATGLSYTWVGIPTTPSGNCLIRASRSTIVTPGTLTLFCGGRCLNANFSSDGNRVISGSADGFVYIWDSHTTTLLQSYHTESGVGVPDFQALNFWAIYSPDMKTFATTSPSSDPSPYGNMIRIFDAATGTKLQEWHIGNDPNGVHTSGMCRFSPDGKRLATTAKDSIYVFDASSGSILAKLSGFTRTLMFGAVWGVPTSLDWKVDGSEIIASAGIHQDSLPSYVIANSTTGDTLHTYRLNTKLPFFAENEMIHYSPDGTKFIASSDDTSVRVWDVASGTVLWRIQPGLRQAVDAVFSHDGKTVATVGYDSLGLKAYNVKLWDATTGAFIRFVGSVGFASKTIEFSPDDSRILISGSAANIIFQNPVGGTESDVSDGVWSIIPNNGGNIVVYTPNRDGHINDVVSIPVLIDDPGGAVAAGATQVTFSVSYNVTILDPISPTPKGTITGNVRTMTFSLPIVPTDTVLTTLTFRVALGNDSQTTMAVISPTTNAPTVTATNQDGIFTMLDMCYAGGPRLVNPNGVVTMVVEKNPTNDAITVDLSLIEDGHTSLVLFDANGREVSRPLDSDILHGARTLRMPCAALASGYYFLTLQTPNNRITSRVEVQR